MNKICKKCNKEVNSNFPDPCIGKYIEGVSHACCGHGNINQAYCCGFDNCKPNESVAPSHPDITKIPMLLYNKDKQEYILNEKYFKINEIGAIESKIHKPGYWIKRKQEALDFMLGE